jgi:hypothetical protein
MKSAKCFHNSTPEEIEALLARMKAEQEAQEKELQRDLGPLRLAQRGDE